MLKKRLYVFTAFSGFACMFSLALLSGCINQQQTFKNHLQQASSPYLKEHADNPVDWYEWGDEALDKAKKENKPLLISIGYSSCHWCHVMEEESFMDTAVARIMNENFICVKVDREERPDIDNIYSNALQLLTGSSGWPLQAFALPDGKPFFAGTYYPKNSWIKIVTDIAGAYKNKNKLVVTQANALINGIAGQQIINADSLNETDKTLPLFYERFSDSIYKYTDFVNGGLAGIPKFPNPAFIDFMLQRYYISGDIKALNAATTTLNKIASGGIYDQLEAGFSRYTTDSAWRIPHFEKMLYDNGQLLSVYAHAYQLTKNEDYKKIITETISFVEKNMAAPGGGYYSSLNADSETGEGKYYSWTADDFLNVTGNDKMIAEYFHITRPGNWVGADNILYTTETAQEFAANKKLDINLFSQKIDAAKKYLLKARIKRTKPTIDTKIITSWNGIMLKGLADAYAATGNKEYLDKARQNALFIETYLLTKDGSLKRSYVKQGTAVSGFMEDYAWTAAAFLRFYEVTFDTHWLKLSKLITDYSVAHFFNDRSGLFYFSQSLVPGLNTRNIEIEDKSIPSSNAVMAKVLYTIGTVYDDTAYINKAAKMISSVIKRAEKMPQYYLQWGIFSGFLSAKSYEVVIIGDDAVSKNTVFQQNYFPTCIVMGGIEEGSLPLLKNKLISGKTFIYVCSNKMCKKPEEEIAKAISQVK